MFIIYKAEVENQLNRKIKVVRSDYGGEYYGRYDGSDRCPGSLVNFLKECDIIPQYTIPETPHQNGITERRNHMLKYMVWSMIFYIILPESL